MSFRCGLVGLPNVGKSTLFNALTRSANARTANFPFCTIEPNAGAVTVPDPRLDVLAEMVNAAQTIYARIDFVDIAGLIRGASEGEGLGNKFLGHIREMEVCIYVLRCFEDDNITHVEGRIDPIADAETLHTEMMLADIDSLEKRIATASKRAKSGDAESLSMLASMQACLDVLHQGKPALEAFGTSQLPLEIAPSLHLLTTKPILYVANVSEEDVARGNALSDSVVRYAEERGSKAIVLSAHFEEELAEFSDSEAAELLLDRGIEKSGLERFIRAGYQELDLITFFTAGPKEARAWTVAKGTPAAGAAGVIHTDFEKNFIRAEVTSYEDFIASGGSVAARDSGKTRLEGRNYSMRDGDVVYFRVGK